MAYNLFYAVAFPLYNTANSALVPVSTRNSKQRGTLASFVNMAALGGIGAGSIVMPMIILVFANAFPGPVAELPSSNGYLILFVIIGIVTCVGCILQYYFTRERITEEGISNTVKSEDAPAEKGPSLKKQAKAIFSDRFFIAAIVFYLLFQLSGGIKNASIAIVHEQRSV